MKIFQKKIKEMIQKSFVFFFIIFSLQHSQFLKHFAIGVRFLLQAHRISPT